MVLPRVAEKVAYRKEEEAVLLWKMGALLRVAQLSGVVWGELSLPQIPW